jgi:DNA-binding MarR family transcriptional regulator
MLPWDPFHEPDQPIELFLTVYKTNHLLVKRLEDNLQTYDLTLGRLCVLVCLKRFGKPMLPSELSDDLAVTRANISGLLNALEKKQFVRRDFDPTDRRRILVDLTEAGDMLLVNVWPIYVQTVSESIEANLSPAEQIQLSLLLRKFS